MGIQIVKNANARLTAQSAAMPILGLVSARVVLRANIVIGVLPTTRTFQDANLLPGNQESYLQEKLSNFFHWALKFFKTASHTAVIIGVEEYEIYWRVISPDRQKISPSDVLFSNLHISVTNSGTKKVLIFSENLGT